MTNVYMKELQELKPWDEVQVMKPVGRGYNFIFTAGHGYLVVPKQDPYYSVALGIAEYGFKGQHAVYLEEDCEASKFKELLGK